MQLEVDVQRTTATCCKLMIVIPHHSVYKRDPNKAVLQSSRGDVDLGYNSTPSRDPTSFRVALLSMKVPLIARLCSSGTRTRSATQDAIRDYFRHAADPVSLG